MAAHLALTPDKPFSYDDAHLVDDFLNSVGENSWDDSHSITSSGGFKNEDDAATLESPKFNKKTSHLGIGDSSRSLKNDDGVMTPRQRLLKGGSPLFLSFKTNSGTDTPGIPTSPATATNYLVHKGILA